MAQSNVAALNSVALAAAGQCGGARGVLGRVGPPGRFWPGGTGEIEPTTCDHGATGFASVELKFDTVWPLRPQAAFWQDAAPTLPW